MTNAPRRPSLRALENFSKADFYSDVSTEEVLKREISWDKYRDLDAITRDQIELLTDLRGAPRDDRVQLVLDAADDLASLFVQALQSITDEDAVLYLLCLVNQILLDDVAHSRFFRNVPGSYKGFLAVLRRNYSSFTIATAAIVVSRLFVQEKSANAEMGEFVDWITNRVERPVGKSNREREADLIHCLQALKMFNRTLVTQTVFVARGGLALLKQLLKSYADSNGQIVYLVGFSLLLLSYHDENVDNFAKERVVEVLVNALRVGIREKVSRIILSTLNNLADKDNFNEAMIDAGIIKIIFTLESRQWVDTDIDELIAELNEKLQKDFKVLSSVERYEKELKTETLSWGPVHTEKFWQENHHYFGEDNFKLIRFVAALLRSQDPRTVAVACYDLGEFCRFSSHGKRVVKKLGIKEKMMACMNSKDSDVAKQALLAVQKLMVKNWEMLQRSVA